MCISCQRSGIDGIVALDCSSLILVANTEENLDVILDAIRK